MKTYQLDTKDNSLNDKSRQWILQEIENRIDYFYKTIDGYYQLPQNREGNLIEMMAIALKRK